MKYKIINFLGGPGTGKSTTAAHQFSLLKRRCNCDVGLDLEYVKQWVYMGYTPKGFDGLKILAASITGCSQMFLGGVELIITDSGALTSLYYEEQRVPGQYAAGTKMIWEEFNKQYPALNIFLTRCESRPYVAKGRYQEEEVARQIDVETKQYLIKHNIPFITAPSHQQPLIFEILQKELGLTCEL